jgi:hypothetical protein
MRIPLILFAAGLLACAATARYRRGGGSVGELAVRRVEWNPTRAPLEKIEAVAESGDRTAIFSAGAATVLRGGAVLAVDRDVAGWRRAAGAIPAGDGNGAWLVGIDDHGEPRRLRADSRFERVGARFGLDGAAVSDVRATGGAGIAFLLENEIALSDGAHLQRFPVAAARSLAGGGGRAAVVDNGGVQLIDAAKGTTRRFAIEGAQVAELDENGRLYVATAQAIYVEDRAGALALAYLSDDDQIHDLAIAGTRLWFADGDELGAIDGERIRVTRGARIDRSATLTGSPSGDAWVLSRGGLARFTVDDAALGPLAQWEQAVAPVFARACAECHRPGGSAGIDLSSLESWEARRGLLRERLIAKRSMPPAGHALDEADREILRTWLDGR